MILVTGGTGLIGSHLLFRLVGDGKPVRAIYRDKNTLKKVVKVFGYYADAPAELMDKIDWVKADITNLGELNDAFDDVQYVYHCAALISFDPKQYNALYKINVEGTANMVNLGLKHEVKKFCYVSSIAAIGPSIKDQMITENNEWSDTNASVYGLTKHEAELEVWRAAQEGLPIAIVNPGVVIGPGFWKSGSGTFFTYAAKGEKSVFPGGTGFVTVNDVVNAVLMLMDSNVHHERFIMVSENLSYKAFLQKIATKLGVDPPTNTIPFWQLELFWRLDWLRSAILDKRRRLSKVMAKELYHQNRYGSDKLKDVLNFSFEDLDEAISFCCTKFRE